MTESAVGGWHDYTWVTGSGIEVASKTGVVALGFIPATGLEFSTMGKFIIGGISDLSFTAIDLTETEKSIDPNVIYRGGIQSIDKGFTASPILIPIPLEFPVGFDIGFVESATINISGVWFDGIGYTTKVSGEPPFEVTENVYSRDMMLEDIRTRKKIVNTNYQQSPLVLLMSSRAYPVFITAYSANLLGGQGNIVSFRLALSISSFMSHYNYSG